MRRTLRPLVLLHANSTLRTRLFRLAPGRFDIRTAQDWDEFEEGMREVLPAGIGVVDPYRGRPAERSGVAPELSSLLLRLPSATIVAALLARPGWLEDVRVMGERGIAEVIDLEAESTDLLVLQGLEGARSRAIRSLLESELRLGTTGRGRTILDAAIWIVASGGQGRDLARVLNMHRDTLLRWCKRAGLPNPRQLLLWMRILLAADLLDNPGQTVEGVASACGYSSDDALARALALHLGYRPARLRDRGAFRVASARFADELNTLRAQGRRG